MNIQIQQQKNKVRIGSSLRGGGAGGSGGLGLVIANIGKFWVGFKEIPMISDGFVLFLGGVGWFWMFSGWFRMVLDDSSWFAVLVVTTASFTCTLSTNSFF